MEVIHKGGCVCHEWVRCILLLLAQKDVHLICSLIHCQHFSQLEGKRQCPLDGVMSLALGAVISFHAAQTDVGEQVSSL